MFGGGCLLRSTGDGIAKLELIQMLKLVYHDGYNIDLGDHVFPAVKYRMIREALNEWPVETPEPASDADVMLVHTRAWTEALRDCTLMAQQMYTLEIPWGPHTVKAFWLAAGGTILAARLALRDGIGFNIGGGFHHAFADHGEGFCALHDVAIAIRKMQQEGLAQRIMVIDTDVHHGNGTAGIFAGDSSVFTLSIHQYANYPAVKPPSTVDLHLPDGVEDEEYLEILRPAATKAFQNFRPDLLFYVAGADPYKGDQLGGLKLSIQGLMERDRLVIEGARSRKIPVAITLAGGYARRVEDTVTIHANTARVAAEIG